jgi:hypothetical protein
MEFVISVDVLRRAGVRIAFMLISFIWVLDLEFYFYRFRIVLISMNRIQYNVAIWSYDSVYIRV